MKKIFFFNPCNPTGHYLLDLSIGPDYAVAERLLLLNQWEKLLVSRSGDWMDAEAGSSREGKGKHRGSVTKLALRNVARSLPPVARYTREPPAPGTLADGGTGEQPLGTLPLP